MYRFFCVIFIVALAVITACESDYSFRGDASSIVFSADTVSFDTLMAGKGSASARLVVYNVSGEDMTLDLIHLVNRGSSDYNVNINGSRDGYISGVHLRSGDSLYIFVTVFPRYNAGVPYLVTEDEIEVKAGSNVWSSKLWACGLSARKLSGEISADTTLTSDVPYLVEGDVVVHSGATLTIDEGAVLYCSNGAHIDVRGRLVSCGSIERPVSFRYSRLEKFYDDMSGQWEGISLSQAGASAVLRHTSIANSDYGISADFATSVELDAVYLRDVKHRGVSAFDAEITITNSTLTNCGEALLHISGGTTRVVHSTLSCFYKWNSRFESAVTISLNDTCPSVRSFLMANSVVVGNESNELDMPDDLSSEQCLFSHCYMRLGTMWHEDSDPRFDAVIVGKDPGFVSRDDLDYHLTAESPLVGAASLDYLEEVPYDADGVLRNVDGSVDIGAFECVSMPVE